MTLGVDLGQAMFSQAGAISITVYSILPIAVTIVAAVLIARRDRPEHREGSRQGSRRTWWWPGPNRNFQARLREADQLDAAGSSDAAVQLRLNAITEFSRKASEERLVEYGDDIQRNLVLATVRQPAGAVTALAELDRHCPRCVTKDMTSSVVREWARSRELTLFGDGWATIETVLASHRQDPLEVLLKACQGVSRDELTETFRRGLTAYLWTRLDRALHLATSAAGPGLVDHNRAFELLDMVGRTDLSRADQLCALGDLALNRKSSAEALRRYEAAVKRGSMPAAQRLAYHQAREGHRLLVAGDFAASRRQFTKACQQYKDQEYALLGAIAGLLSNAVDGRTVLDELKNVEATGSSVPYVIFWRAIAHLQIGDQSQAIALFRELGSQPTAGIQHSAGNQPWGPAEEAAVWLAVLERDDPALIDWARRLIRTYGQRWTTAGPTDPWPMVAVVAQHDRALLTELVTLINNPRELPEWVRAVGAQVLLTRSVDLARRDLAGEADDDAEAATRLLEPGRRTTSSGSP
jgi:tetratricopeptide (TPR) repeat protein